MRGRGANLGTDLAQPLKPRRKVRVDGRGGGWQAGSIAAVEPRRTGPDAGRGPDRDAGRGARPVDGIGLSRIGPGSTAARRLRPGWSPAHYPPRPEPSPGRSSRGAPRRGSTPCGTGPGRSGWGDPPVAPVRYPPAGGEYGGGRTPTHRGRRHVAGPIGLAAAGPGRIRERSSGSNGRSGRRGRGPGVPGLLRTRGDEPMSWDTSDRRERLPRDWKRLRAFVLARDGYRCTAEVHDPRCDGRATDVDHVVAGDDHRPCNLGALSRACHAAKTNRESSIRNALRAEQRRRPPERHPGLL